MNKENNKDLISIIIPVYNVEKYLARCIESVIKQTYTNIEIILIDDGSTDKSGKICDDYKKVDDRIIVFHQENQGLSNARNTGIALAKGTYLTFIDSDDYVVETYVSTLYDLIKEHNADISIGKHYIEFSKKLVNTGTNNLYVLNSKEALKMCLYGDDMDVSAWAKLYKKSLFDEIKYPDGRIFEDSATTYKLLDKAEKIVFHSIPIYYYYIRDNSITSRKFGMEKLDLIKTTKEMAEYIVNKYDDLEDAANRRVMYSYLSTLTKIVKVNRKDSKLIKSCKKEIMKYIKENRKKVLKDAKIPKRDRIALQCSKFGYTIFKVCWLLYEKVVKE